jgi:hypothetical protein
MIQQVIRSQYHASLDMLEYLLRACPDSRWNNDGDKNRTWHLAYHALFYVHLYLQPTEADFVPWEKGREDYQFMGPRPFPPHTAVDITYIYTRTEILDYLALCREQVDTVVEQLDLHGESGFDWLPMSKLELQFYSIRHLMEHVGELGERLGQGHGVETRWIGMHKEA